MTGKLRLRKRQLIAAILCCAAIQGCNSKDAKITVPAKDSDGSNYAGDATGSAANIQFQDVTGKTRITAKYQNGEESGAHSIVESLGGGVGVFDFDQDGLGDLFFPGGGQLSEGEPLKGENSFLYRNGADWSFQAVADDANIATAPFYSHGCAMGDFDADGFPDLLLTGYGGLQLFRNQGDGTFVEISRDAGMTDNQWSTSAAWADLNGDSHLDVYITHYVDWSWKNNPACTTPVGDGREICSPQDFDGLLDLIYFNNGDGTFRGGDKEFGIDIAGKGLGVVASDFNGDAAVDIYVANDTTNNLLFINDGNGRFRESGVLSGTALDQRGVSNGSMGVAVLDYNNDLQPDIWVTNYENETFALYHNDRNGFFRCLTEATGVTAIGTLYVGFGTVAADFRRTGAEDIVVSNGHVMRYPINSPIAQEPLFLVNDGNGKIFRQSFANDSYFSTGHRGRGVVTSDLDNDGKLDLVFSHVNEDASVLRQSSQHDGDWLTIELIGRRSNRDAIGSTVILNTDRRQMLRTVTGGGSYLSQNSHGLYFGIPKGDRFESIRVIWPDGASEERAIPEVNTKLRIVQ